MDSSSSQPDCEQIDHQATSVAKLLAPEDVRAGDYVAVLRVTYEVPSFYWCGEPALEDRSDLVRLRMLPDQPAMPLKVVAVCLPFVLVSSPTGEARTLDLRRHQIARLDRSFAKSARRLRKAKSKQRAKQAKSKK